MTDVEARKIAGRMILARGNEQTELVDILMSEIASLGGLDDAQTGLLLSDEEIAHWEKDIDVEPLPDPISEEAPIEPEDEDDDEEELTATRPRRQAGQRRTGREGLDIDLTGIVSEAQDDEDLDEAAEFLNSALGATEDLEGDEETTATSPRRQAREHAPRVRDKRPAPKHYRVNHLFVGDESEVVKRVLGRAPAARILQMCRYWEQEDMDQKLLELEASEDEPEETLAATE